MKYGWRGRNTELPPDLLCRFLASMMIWFSSPFLMGETTSSLWGVGRRRWNTTQSSGSQTAVHGGHGWLYLCQTYNWVIRYTWCQRGKSLRSVAVTTAGESLTPSITSDHQETYRGKKYNGKRRICQQTYDGNVSFRQFISFKFILCKTMLHKWNISLIKFNCEDVLND